MSYTIKTIDELESIHHGAVKLAGAELGIRSFGMQVLDFPAGFADYPEHDHADEGQEEVYLVLRGAGEFLIDGDRVSLSPGQILHVEPTSRRKLLVGPEGVRLLALGCPVEGKYVRPEDFRSKVQA